MLEFTKFVVFGWVDCLRCIDLQKDGHCFVVDFVLGYFMFVLAVLSKEKCLVSFFME
jgi:hypothetical protein